MLEILSEENIKKVKEVLESFGTVSIRNLSKTTQIPTHKLNFIIGYLIGKGELEAIRVGKSIALRLIKK